MCGYRAMDQLRRKRKETPNLRIQQDHREVMETIMELQKEGKGVVRKNWEGVKANFLHEREVLLAVHGK